MSIHLILKWEEQRIQLYRNTSYLQHLYLRKIEQGKLWSPQIVIGTNNKVSQTETALEFGVYQEEGMPHAWAIKEMDLTTEIRCKSKHECIIEVCMIDVYIPLSISSVQVSNFFG